MPVEILSRSLSTVRGESGRLGKTTAGPQSQILDGVTYEDISKMTLNGEDVIGQSDRTVLIGTASKGIIDRQHQHNAQEFQYDVFKRSGKDSRTPGLLESENTQRQPECLLVPSTKTLFGLHAVVCFSLQPTSAAKHRPTSSNLSVDTVHVVCEMLDCLYITSEEAADYRRGPRDALDWAYAHKNSSCERPKGVHVFRETVWVLRAKALTETYAYIVKMKSPEPHTLASTCQNKSLDRFERPSSPYQEDAGADTASLMQAARLHRSYENVNASSPDIDSQLSKPTDDTTNSEKTEKTVSPTERSNAKLSDVEVPSKSERKTKKSLFSFMKKKDKSSTS
ncbi:hypothetical protein TELCIR_01826 [Teladorsagia circumcincta]|uniref:Uncharacterized protein n=1 Tax=Teladorsagia circumcincta TaxID=45464 RepID=A0A2G9V0W0_TELCI|nr:hypothetical protein TELCIR_01826 [Teladorsagia circumcincta]